MKNPPALLLPLFIAACAWPLSTLSAVEQQLQLGPDNFNLRGGFLSEQVDKGATRSNEPVAYGLASIRYMNIGFQGEMWLALQDDDSLNVDAGDNTEIRFRLDYLFEKEDFYQIIPHLETSYYPSLPSSVEEPMWLGVDGWYLTQWEGIEIGGSLDYDMNSEYGLYGSFASRQFYQNSPVDIMTWQALNFGDSDFHEAYSGSDSAGFTTLELGVDITLPMPWENTWLTFSLEAHTWLMSDDRDRIDDDSSFLVGVTVFHSDRLR